MNNFLFILQEIDRREFFFITNKINRYIIIITVFSGVH